MRETVKSLRVYMFLGGAFSLIVGLANLLGDGSRGAVPATGGGAIIGLVWLVVAFKLPSMLVHYRGLVITLFGISLLNGVRQVVTGLWRHDNGSLYCGIATVLIALYLWWNAARLSRELRAATAPGTAGTAGSPVNA